MAFQWVCMLISQWHQDCHIGVSVQESCCSWWSWLHFLIDRISVFVVIFCCYPAFALMGIAWHVYQHDDMNGNYLLCRDVCVLFSSCMFTLKKKCLNSKMLVSCLGYICFHQPHLDWFCGYTPFRCSYKHRHLV